MAALFLPQQAKSVHTVWLQQTLLLNDATATADTEFCAAMLLQPPLLPHSVNDSICYNVIQLLQQKITAADILCEWSLIHILQEIFF